MHANDKAIGRSWYTADSASLTDYGDCFRVNLFWNDGGKAFILHDTKTDALAYLADHGFTQ